MLLIETELQRITSGLYMQKPLLIGLGITTALYMTHSFWA